MTPDSSYNPPNPHANPFPAGFANPFPSPFKAKPKAKKAPRHRRTRSAYEVKP